MKVCSTIDGNEARDGSLAKRFAPIPERYLVFSLRRFGVLTCRLGGTTLAALALSASSAHAQGLVVAPAKGCNSHTAVAAEPGEVAGDPSAYAGKCVKLQGWWKDIGFYPTRAEAAVIDSLSIVLLDNRRIGLYLPKQNLDTAPQGPKLATVIGTVGACAKLPAAVTAADTGYCHYKGGAYMAVSRITLTK